MIDIREGARLQLQGHLDRLQQPDGFTVDVKFAFGGPRVGGFHAGMRVLQATPIFDRKTGKVENWRYWILFAEMGILDRFAGNHPVHVFEVEIVEQEEHVVRLRSVDGMLTFLICRNDPHFLSEEQAAFYEAWDANLKAAGGETALAAILDRQAEEWLEQIERTRGVA